MAAANTPAAKDAHGEPGAALWSDERVEKIMGTLLQTGVIISGLVVFVGGILYFLQFRHAPEDYRNFVAERASLRSVTAVGKRALGGDGRAIIQVGLLLLIATPVARVIFSIIAFELEKDRLYVLLTVIVFLILLYSLFGGGT
jgi:uncharacterized membrane protein